MAALALLPKAPVHTGTGVPGVSALAKGQHGSVYAPCIPSTGDGNQDPSLLILSENGKAMTNICLSILPSDKLEQSFSTLHK